MSARPAELSTDSPTLVGRRAVLTPVSPSDYDFLWAIETSPELNFRWRLGGRTPSPDEFVASVWDGVLASFVVRSVETNQPVGVVTAYDADFRTRTCWVAVATAPGTPDSGYTLEAMGLLVDYCFTVWDFRILYAASSELNYRQFAGGAGAVFEEHGRLREHTFYDGRYWDKILLGVTRADWQSARSEVLGHSTASIGIPGLDVESFLGIAQERLGIDLMGATLDTPIDADHGFDSLDRYRLVVLVEELGGGDPMPEDLIAELRVIGDCFHHYCVRSAPQA